MFHQGIQTRENGMKHEREARVFYCFRVFGPLMKHEKRVVYITSQLLDENRFSSNNSDGI